jgi:hypothetical protein
MGGQLVSLAKVVRIAGSADPAEGAEAQGEDVAER